MDAQLQSKLQALKDDLASIGPCAVAFSAGVDSTLLLAVAHEVLADDVIAITADSPVQPARELEEAQDFCASRGIRHIVVSEDQFNIEGFDRNPPERCYLCKQALFGHIMDRAADEGHPHVLEGSNTDDMHDYRPGYKAVEELGVKSPLLDAGLSKQDIRAISYEMDLPTFNKQSFACLATRFATNTTITREKLAIVGAAEQLLLDLGLSTVRVRFEGSTTDHQGATARIEVDPHEFSLIMDEDNRNRIVRNFKTLGFAHVSLDLEGYRTGSMNTVLDSSPV